jgi:transcriptional regulator of acetoin/glycerol metabolism
VDAFEKEKLLDALKKANWVRSRAAETLDIPRPTLNYKMAKHNIIPPEGDES